MPAARHAYGARGQDTPMARATPVEGLGAHLSLPDAARRVIGVRTADVAAWTSYVDDPTAVTELHNLRIAGKRLRYSLELLQTAFGDDAIRLLDDVQEMQELLGAIHDDDVLLTMIRSQIGASALTGALARADEIIRVHGAGKDETALSGELPGLFVLLETVAARRQERYQAFHTWWAAHDDLPARLVDLVAGPRPAQS
jgi:CHAD domain-containing protein